MAGKQVKVAVTVVAGTPEVVYTHGAAPLTVSCDVTSGGTLDVEWTLNQQAEIDSATAVWHPWDKGQISADDGDSLLSPVVALRFTATTQNSVVRVLSA